MKTVLIFAAGLLFGVVILFAWAFFKIKQKAYKLPVTFTEVHLQRLPMDGTWFVFWGGDRANQNAHHGVPAQNLALDLVVSPAEKFSTHKSDGKTNEDYFCWSLPVFAAKDGKVIISVDGVPDNKPGIMNPQMVYGNVIMIQHEPNVISVYAHLKNGSVMKRVGQEVKAGDQLGECGNSGNSSEPHLHFHVQSQPGFEQGVALRPLFENITVNTVTKTNYYPVKSDRIKNKEVEQGAAANP